MVREKLKETFGNYPVDINDGYSKYSIYEAENESLVFEDKKLGIKQRLPGIILGLIILIIVSFKVTKTEGYYLFLIIPILFWLNWKFKPQKIVAYKDRMIVEFKSLLGYKKTLTYLRNEILAIEATPIEYSMSNQFMASITVTLVSGKKWNLLSVLTLNKEASIKVSNTLASIYNHKLSLSQTTQVKM